MECAGGLEGIPDSGELVEVTIGFGKKIGAGDALVELLKHSAQPSTGCDAQASEVMAVPCVAKSSHPSGQQTTSASAEVTKNTNVIRDTARNTTCSV